MIKRKLLKKYFFFFFVPKAHFYITHTLLLQHTQMFNLDDIANEHNKEQNLKWQYTLDHPYRMLIIGGSGSGKRNTLLNLIKEQDSDNLSTRFICMQKT